MHSRTTMAQDLAGKAALLEIGANTGLLDAFQTTEKDSVHAAAMRCHIPPDFVQGYFDALTHVGLLKITGNDEFSTSASFNDEVARGGYLLWALVSCAPLIERATQFAENMPKAASEFSRDGAHVARTSFWMGQRDFYPQAVQVILDRKPRKFVDLGAGAGRLLIRCISEIPDSTGIGIDLSEKACDTARANISKANLTDRIAMIQAPIQSLIEQPAPLEQADIVHAGFVFHDLMPDERPALVKLLRQVRAVAPTSEMVIVDAIPYAADETERSFSTAFTFLHHYFMERSLPTEEDWKEVLREGGFGNVEVHQLGISGGRIFHAKP